MDDDGAAADADAKKEEKKKQVSGNHLFALTIFKADLGFFLFLMRPTPARASQGLL